MMKRSFLLFCFLFVCLPGGCQNHISRVRYRALTFHIQYRKILKVEDKDAISWLNKYLGVNTKVRYNTTEHVNDEIVWDSRSVEIVNQLYYEDFREYKYTMKSPA